MGELKYLVLFLVSASLSQTVYCQLQQPFYGYPGGYPYQPGHQVPLPYQPSYGIPSLPVGGSQIYSARQQNYPYYPSPSYNPYGSVYPSYPSYPVYPSYPSSYPSYPSFYPTTYPSYPYQPTFQNHPDPYAHLPTEIIDVDENGRTIDSGIIFEEPSPKFELVSSHHAIASGPTHLPLGPITTSSVVTSKPLKAVITRTYDGSESSEPAVDVKYSDPNSQSGSGTLVAATGDEDENAQAKSGGDEDASSENTVQKSNEEEEKTNEDEEESKPSKFWGK